MAYSVINIYDDKLNSRRDFLCDDTSDINSLPTQDTETEEFPEGIGTGSTAVVTGTLLIYILGNQGTWVQLCTLSN